MKYGSQKDALRRWPSLAAGKRAAISGSSDGGCEGKDPISGGESDRAMRAREVTKRRTFFATIKAGANYAFPTAMFRRSRSCDLWLD